MDPLLPPSFDGDGDVDQWLLRMLHYTCTNVLKGRAYEEWKKAVDNREPVRSWGELREFLLRRVKPQPARVETEKDRVANFLATLEESDPHAAEYVRGKAAKNVRRAQALVKEYNTPEEKLCCVCYVGNDYGVWLRGKINGKGVSMQFSNNSDNFISKEAVQRLGLETVRCKPFVMGSVFSGGGERKVWNTKVVDVEVEFENGLKLRMDYAVVELARHDLIVGRELIDECDQLIMDWSGESPALEMEVGRNSYRCVLHEGRP